MTIVRITMSVAACTVDLIVAHASVNVSMQSYIFAFYRKRGHIYKYTNIDSRPTAAGPSRLYASC